jgi:phage baseplate assembly protein W
MSSILSKPSDRAQVAGALGVGIAFPFRFSASTGGVVTSYAEAHTQDRIKQILGTRTGERVIRREFGSNIHPKLFKPQPQAEGELSAEIGEALSRWEKQVTFDRINFTSDPNTGVTSALIGYTILRSYQEGNMVYPFTEPETGG